MGRHISLEELLAGRDARARRQQELLAAYPGAALISFTVNYPGPVKAGEEACFLHREGARAIGRQFLYAPLPHYELREKDTGPEGFWLVEEAPERVKRRCCELEETHPLGRLFDIDVLGPGGVPVGRAGLGLPPRRCLLCGGDPALCRRAERHTLEELTGHIHRIVADYRAAHPEAAGGG